MAARSTAMGQRPGEREAVRRVEPARAGRSRPALGVVDRQAAIDRARRRQSRVLLALSGGILASALTAAAAAHAVLAVTQIRADNLRSELATALARQQNLQLERADLEAPGRVLWLAEHRFKMVAPHQVTYLEPVNPGETVEQAHRSPAGAATHRRRSR